MAVILVGNNPASEIYVRKKEEACKRVAIRFKKYDLNESISQEDLIKLIKELNNNPSINGILIQLPLLKGINQQEILKVVDPVKDVDGFHPSNVGRFFKVIPIQYLQPQKE